MSEQIRTLGRKATWLAVFTLAALSLVPGDLRPHTGMPGRFEHFTAYGLTGAAIAVGYAARFTRWTWWGALTVAAFTFEIMQAYIPNRSPAALDAVASSSGLALGLLVASVLVDQALRLNTSRLQAAPPSERSGRVGE